MIQKIKQYKNLILLAAVAVFLILLVAADPLGYFARRVHDRAAIRNAMAIEEAETEKKVALIKAEMDAELRRIMAGEAEQ